MEDNIQQRNSKLIAKQQILHEKPAHFRQQTDQNLASMENSRIANKQLLQ